MKDPKRLLRRLVILGGAGDLAARSLLPALAELREADLLPNDFVAVAVGREAGDTGWFRRWAADALDRHADQVDSAARAAILPLLEYGSADVTAAAELRSVLGSVDQPTAVYLALPPPVFEPAVSSLAEFGLPAGSRIVVEKPFGWDLASAQALERRLQSVFPEEAIHRVDHFLGKQTVQNILGLRFANRIFEPVWHREHVERVEIVWDETLTVGDRAAYYDGAGALRDMVQNHLLQMLCLVAMEVPLTLGEHDVRDRKAEILHAVHRLEPAEVERLTVRGRYTAGRIGDREVPAAYADEPGVDPGRETETFAAVTLSIDTWRWADVPFVLRSGKALGSNTREIAVRFRRVPHLAFGQPAEPRPNVLRLRLDPDGVALAVSINGPGDPFALEEVELELDLAPQEPSAYGRVILDVLSGDPTLSIRADEAEESWRIVEPILESWARGTPRLGEYPAGSSGSELAAMGTLGR